MNLNIEKDIELRITEQVERIMSILYPDSNNDFKLNNIEVSTCNDLDFKATDTTTALVVQKDYGIINPNIVFKIKKSLKLSLRSLFISASLTILNLFI